MRTKLILVFSLFLLSSCIEIQDVEFKALEGVKIEKIEGRNISILLTLKLINPNFFSIKIKPSIIDFYIDDQLMGKIKLNSQIKLLKKIEKSYSIPLQIILEDGVMINLLKYSLKDKVKIHLKGFVKGAVYGISKSIEIDETTELDDEIFKLSSILGK